MLHFLLLAALLSAATPAIAVVDQNGNPIAHADVQRLPDGSLRVSAPGCEARVVRAGSDVRRIVLQRAMPVIAAVRVATGSAQNLHSLPVAASALDSATIATSPALTSDGLLRLLPGFDRTRSNSMFSNYGLLRVSFAGSGSDRGLVLADGVPAQDGFGGQIDWAAYPPQSLERAELLMGAGSALYGAGAVGGVLDLQSAAPPAAASPPNGTLQFAAGNLTYSRVASTARAWLSPRLSASFIAQEQRMQYADLPPAYASPIDCEAQSDAAMAALRLHYAATARDSLELGERGAWDDQFEGRPHYTFARRLAQTDLRYTHAAPHGTLQAVLYARTAYIENAADLFPAKPGVARYVQNVPTNDTGASVSWIGGREAAPLELRADVRHVGGLVRQYAASGALQSQGGGSQNLDGFAAQESLRLKRAQFVAGARFDTVYSTPSRRTDAAISPRVAARYDLTSGLSVRASAGAGLRAPFLNELVRGYVIGATTYEPNPALVPERSRTDSAGIDWIAGAQRLSLDAFDTTVDDAIMFRTIDATHQQRSNVAQTRTNGYTLTLTRGLSACSRLSASFTNQYARVTRGPAAILSKRLQYVPSQSATLGYTVASERAAAGVSLTYAGQTYADDLNAQPLGTAVVAAAGLRFLLAGDATLDIDADNLTNARYLSSIDRYAPPARLAIGVSLPVGTGNNLQRGLRCTP